MNQYKLVFTSYNIKVHIQGVARQQMPVNAMDIARN